MSIAAAMIWSARVLVRATVPGRVDLRARLLLL